MRSRGYKNRSISAAWLPQRMPLAIGVIVVCLVVVIIALPQAAMSSGLVAVELHGAATGYIHTVKLEAGDVAIGGTDAIYEKEGHGFYFDAAAMSAAGEKVAIEVPTCDNFVFAGYYTERNGGGVRFIDGAGYLTEEADASFFTEDGELYGLWRGEGAADVDGEKAVKEPDLVTEYVIVKVKRSIVALAAGSVWTVTLDGNSGTDAGDSKAIMGTEKVYLKYGNGWYLDAVASSQQMSASANGIAVPTRKAMQVSRRVWVWGDDVDADDQWEDNVGYAEYGSWTYAFEETDHDYRFGGFWTGANGTGTQIIGDDGHLVTGASAVLADGNTTLYARWYCTVSYYDDEWEEAYSFETQLGVPVVPDPSKIPAPSGMPEGMGYYPGFWQDISLTYSPSGRKIQCRIPGYYRCAMSADVEGVDSEAQAIPCDSDMSLSLSYCRVLHFIHYIDGTSLLEQDSKYLQLYSSYGGNNNGTNLTYLSYYMPKWFDEQFNGSSINLMTIDSVYGSSFSLGWQCLGWQEVEKDSRVAVSKPPLGNMGRSTYFLGIIGYDMSQYWGAVYTREVTVSYLSNRFGVSDSVVGTTTWHQSITTHAPISTAPYGIVGSDCGATGGTPTTSSIQSYNPSRTDYKFDGWSTSSDVYDWESDPYGTQLMNYGAWSVDGKCTRASHYVKWKNEYVAIDSGITQQSLWTDRAPSVELYAIERPNVYYCNLYDATGPTMGYVARTDSTDATAEHTDTLYEFYGIGYSLDYKFTKRIKETGSGKGDYHLAMPTGIGGQFDGYYTEKDGEGRCVIDANGCVAASADATEISGKGTSSQTWLYETWTTPVGAFDATTGTMTVFSTQSSINNAWWSHSDVNQNHTVKDVTGRTWGPNLYWGFGNGYDASNGWSPYDELLLGHALYGNDVPVIKHLKIAEGQTVHWVNCGHMFSGQTTLENVEGLDRVDTTGCISFDSMFANCTRLASIDGLSSWDTSSATSAAHMFDGCAAMANMCDVSGWRFPKAMTLECMFAGCNVLSDTPTCGNWGVSETCTTLEGMFRGCAKLTATPDVSRWDTQSATSLRRMFAGCTNIATAPAVGSWNVSNVQDIAFMFEGCKRMNAAPDMTAWRTGALVHAEYVFSNCINMATTPIVSGWNTTGVTSLSHVFYNCESMPTAPSLAGWLTANNETVDAMFAGCKKMATAPDLSGLDVSSLKDASQLFYHCEAMAAVPKLFDWSYNGSTSMEGLFTECRAMGGELDLSGWRLSNISSTFAAFWNCGKLEELDISNWDTTYATSNVAMFDYMNSLKAVTLGTGFVFADTDDHGSAYAAYTCKLPTPMPHGLWMNSSHADAEGVTPAALKSGWSATGSDNSYNAGRYVTALALRYMNHEAEMDRDYVPWDTDFSAKAATGMSNQPVFASGSGWGFAGWAVNDATNTVSYGTGDTVNIKDDAVLYGVYSRALAYTYYPSATATSATTSNVTQYYRTNATQGVTVPIAMASSAYGWKPIGWHRSDTTPTSAYDEIDLVADATNPDADSTETHYYAVYERDGVTVNYNGNNETGGSTAPTTLVQQFVAGAGTSTLPSGSLAANGFEKEDCDFVCWTLGSTSGDEYYVDDEVVDDSAFGSGVAWNTTAGAQSVTMYAEWIATAISFSTPTQVPFFVWADGATAIGGEVASPSPYATRISNTSVFPINVIGLKAASENDVSLVNTVTAGNQMSVTVQPQGYAVHRIADYVSTTFKDVMWHIDKGGNLPLDFVGDDVVKIDALDSDGTAFGRLEFKIEADI